MESLISQFLTQGVFALILTFVRLGTALTIMPGIGDSFTPQNIRLYIALALTVVIAPLVAGSMPATVPPIASLFTLIILEFIIGLFIGTIARILIAALDVAGMVMSLSSGLGNAQLFNPGFSAQGSLLGAFMSVTGVVLLFATNLHHMLIYGVVGSYEVFPVGSVPDTGSMADLMARTVSEIFMLGVQISAPFMVVSLLVYIGMGILARLMPQVQVFLLALPMQIILSLVTMGLVIPAAFIFWLAKYEEGFFFFLNAIDSNMTPETP